MKFHRDDIEVSCFVIEILQRKWRSNNTVRLNNKSSIPIAEYLNDGRSSNKDFKHFNSISMLTVGVAWNNGV